MRKPVTVVFFESLSFTGTTWLNTIVACHPRVFLLGPTGKIPEELPKMEQLRCQVHQEECSFWPKFQRQYDPKENFYIQLARASSKDYIVINNPTPYSKAWEDLSHPDIIVKRIHVVRDGRAVCRSYVHNVRSDFFAAVQWFKAPAESFEFDDQDPDILCIRYEDVVHDQFAYIKRFGEFLGLKYPPNFYKFWEFDHHILMGNASIAGMILRFRCDTPFTGPKEDFYEKEYQRLCREPEKPVLDERWKTELSPRERFLFAYYCEGVNQHWGYPPDCFTLSEVSQFAGELEQVDAPAKESKSDAATLSDLNRSPLASNTVIRVPETTMSFKIARYISKLRPFVPAALIRTPRRLKLTAVLGAVSVPIVSALLGAFLTYLLVN